MKKMTKGALAIGIGSAMLLGGGGTLATWNADAAANAGKIVTGNLDIKAAPGVWTNSTGAVININDYRVIPGEVLTFTQQLDVDLEGDRMKAKLGLSSLPKLANSFSYSTPSLKAGKVSVDPNDLTPANTKEDLTASVTFTFKDVAGQTDVKTTLADLSGINYELTQVTK